MLEISRETSADSKRSLNYFYPLFLIKEIPFDYFPFIPLVKKFFVADLFYTAI